MIDIVNPGITNIDISSVQFCYLRNNKNKWSYTENKKPNFGLIFVKNGSMLITRNGKSNVISKGGLAFLKKGDAHTVSNNPNDPDQHCVFYTASFFGNVNKNFFLKRLQDVERFDKFNSMFSDLLICMEEKNFYYDLKAKRIVYDILYNLGKEQLYYNSHSTVNENIQKVIRYINSNYMNKITVDDMAKISGYSKSYFKKIFQQHFRTPPHKFLMDIRLEQAKTMLESKVFSLNEIAEKCGFGNEYYFSNAFKREIRCSPKRY